MPLADDVPLAFQARAFSDLTDIERVESVRPTGFINITTRAPTRAAMTRSTCRRAVTVFVNKVFDKSYAINGGSAIAPEYQPARDFERYAGVRVSFAY